MISSQPEVQPIAGLLILRPEEPLFFANAERVASEVLQRAGARGDAHTVILSLEETADLDSTALECLIELDRHLQDLGRWLLMSRVKEPIRQLLARWSPQGLGGPDRLHWSADDALESARHTPRNGGSRVAGFTGQN